jgi:hypothetical protein
MRRKMAAALVLSAVAYIMIPALPAAAQEDAIALDGAHCWARCEACETRCETVPSGDRVLCQRSCTAERDRCCVASGRHGTPRTCGCD